MLKRFTIKNKTNPEKGGKSKRNKKSKKRKKYDLKKKLNH